MPSGPLRLVLHACISLPGEWAPSSPDAVIVRKTGPRLADERDRIVPGRPTIGLLAYLNCFLALGDRPELRRSLRVAGCDAHSPVGSGDRPSSWGG
jgi:hypothetical protein